MSITVNVQDEDPLMNAKAIIQALDQSERFFYVIELPHVFTEEKAKTLHDALATATQGKLSFFMLPRHVFQQIHQMDLEMLRSFRDALVELFGQAITIMEKHGPTTDAPPVRTENQP